MLKEFFESLKAHAGQSFPALAIHPGDPPGMRRFYNPTKGAWEVVSPAPPFRSPLALCLRSLASWTLENGRADTTCEVWYSRDGVFGIPDPEVPNTRIGMNLDYTDQFRRLNDIALKSSVFDQKSFIRLMVVELAGCVPVPFINQVRQACWKHAAEATGTVAPSKASIGRSITQELEKGSELPETISVCAKLWKNHWASTTVECAVELHLDTQKFQLTPLAGEIENALRRGEEELNGALAVHLAALVEEQFAGQDYRVYFGNPCLAD